MNVLVTGGASYIGSHTCVELLNAGHGVVVIDNLCNSNAESLKRVQKLTGKTLKFYEGDVRDEALLRKIFAENDLGCVIHFAGLKAVGESVSIPWKYYDNNLNSTLVLTKVMNEVGMKNIIFSSSAPVYTADNELPLQETSRTGNCTNPYGWTKYMTEQILQGLATAEPDWSIGLLRYFNPIGAHESGRIGEDPRGIPNNLMPYVSQVAIGRREFLSVFGNDYDTPDGSCIRDFIYVIDLAKAHVCAMERILNGKNEEAVEIYNVGTGKGVTVFELINTFEKCTGVKLNYKVVARRPGDIEKVWGNVDKANQKLGWKAVHTLEDSLSTAWKWQLELRERGIM